MIINDTEYVVGQDRNEENVVAHLYKGTFDNPGEPMCLRGWNRSNGDGYSIFRGDINAVNGICKICLRRAQENKPPVKSRQRKTKWL
jgi:hypothetical protein